MSADPIPADPTPPVPAQPAGLPVARVANPLDIEPHQFKNALQRRGENRKALIDWVRQSLVDGVDFGAVPLRRGGYSKPSLRKPGAEKICGMLGVTVTFPTLKDYEQAALEGREIHSIIIRCHLLSPDGQIVADGIGARSVEQDHGDLNKALKMACKSAHIDATLRMAGLSEIFTQDLEDMPPEALGGADDASPNISPADPLPPRQSGHATHGVRLATERQVKLLRVKLEQAGIDDTEFCDYFGVSSVGELPFNRVNEALHWIATKSQ